MQPAQMVKKSKLKAYAEIVSDKTSLFSVLYVIVCLVKGSNREASKTISRALENAYYVLLRQKVLLMGFRHCYNLAKSLCALY